ncbi:MAG: hypothetical protein AAF206_22400 [Bacteroidota bacterium]
MKRLSNDWFLEGNLDFEYKKYILLAYLQHVSKEFASYRLYPPLSELISHYNNLRQFQESKSRLLDAFPKKIDPEALRELNLVYQNEVKDGEIMASVGAIISFALPIFQKKLRNGKEIYESIEDTIQLEPIGISPLYKKEGYVLIQISPSKEVKAFAYHVAFFENTDANYYGISFQHRQSFTYSLANTYEAMKRKLVQRFSDLPNPATYLLSSLRPYPEEEAIIPIAKRKMLALLK